MNKRRLVFLPVALLSIGFLSSCNDDAISSRFDNLQSQIDDIKYEIASLKTQIADLKKEMADADQAIKSEYDGKILELNNKIAELNQQLIDISNKHDTDKKALKDDYEAQLATLASSSQSERDKLEQDYNAKIDNLKTTYEAKVAEIESSIAACKSSIDTLRSEMNAALLANQNDYNAKINALTDRVAVLETETYHTVTFDTGLGSHVENQLIKHGEKATKPVDPTRPGFTFEGWTYNGNPWVFYGYVVSEDMTLTANWEYIDYTVTFKNDDGTVLETQTPVHYGDSVTYHGDIPVKPNPVDHYIYTFDGWDADLANITGDTVATAQYTAEYAPYTANFYDDEDNLLYSTFVREGETASYVGETPIKADDNENKLQFQFSGWDEISRTNDTINYKTHFEKCTMGIVFSENRVYQYTGTTQNVFIPAYWNGQAISVIGKRAFEDTSIVSIDIPLGIVSIESNAFNHCDKLETLELPNSVRSLYGYAFRNCTSLTSVVLPETIEAIGSDTWEGVFYGCSSLNQISIPNSVNYICRHAFDGCSSLTSIILPESVDNVHSNSFASCTSLTSIDLSSVKEIGLSVFSGCRSLSSVTLSDELITIGASAFNGCYNLEFITIPKKVERIGSNAFAGCDKLSILVESSYRPIDWDINWNGDTFVVWGYESIETYDGYTYGFGNVDGDDVAYLISFDDSKESFELPSTVDGHAVIGMKTNIFKFNETLKRVVIPNFLEVIPNQIFWYCSNIEEVVMPERVTSIGNGAFFHCIQLRQIVIPEGTTSFGTDVFSGSGIRCIVWPKSITSLPAGAAQLLGGYKFFYSGTKEEWDANSPLSYYAHDVEFESNVNNLYLYRDNKYLFVATNDNRAYGIECIDNVVEFSNFKEEVPSFTPITFDANGFYNCPLLDTVVINSTVQSIGWGCFENCSNLRSVVIEKPMNSLFIEQSAFYSDKAEIYFCGTLEEWNEKITPSNIQSECLIKHLYYYSETDLGVANTYWHYVDGVPTIWE